MLAACGLASIAASNNACTALDGLAGGGSDLPVTPDDGGPRPNPCQKNLDDDHDNCGACGASCGAVEHCLAAKCAPGCPDHTIFVSADGSDNASGCTRATPKRTIGAAMAFLKTVSAQKHEVHVCRGVYAEAVVLDYPTSILGGYECSTWQRSPSYGGPTFDGINESVVTGTPASSPLTIATVQNVKVDGLTLRVQDTTTMRVPAVTANRSARAALSNVKVSGSGGVVSGGTGSVGLLALGGSAASTFERCNIDGGTGRTGVGSASYGIGLFGDAADVTIKSSAVNGGNGICEASCSTTGVAVSTKGKITLLANRIHGGEAKSASLDPISFAGVRLSDYASADVQNSFVFAGNTKKAFGATPTALELRGGGTALVAQSSLAVGPSTTGKGSLLRASTKAGTFANNDPTTAGGLLANGWKLAPSGLACALAKGGTSAVTGLAPLDAFGTMRTDPRAIGAHESEVSCP